jgi:hypothetical protein
MRLPPLRQSFTATASTASTAEIVRANADLESGVVTALGHGLVRRAAAPF